MVQRAGTLFSVFFTEVPVARLRRRAGAAHEPVCRRSSTRCSTAGVSLPPSVFEAWFVSAAHDEAAIGRIVEALPAAARAAAASD